MGIYADSVDPQVLYTKSVDNHNRILKSLGEIFKMDSFNGVTNVPYCRY